MVGEFDDTFALVLVRPQRFPMIGLDFSSDFGGAEVATIIPVYHANEGHQILAKDGYAIAGLNVNYDDGLYGFQPIFMRVKGKSFDRTDSYTGEWIGRAADKDSMNTLGGDGRPVYGIWLNGMMSVDGLALVVEKK